MHWLTSSVHLVNSKMTKLKLWKESWKIRGDIVEAVVHLKWDFKGEKSNDGEAQACTAPWIHIPATSIPHQGVRISVLIQSQKTHHSCLIQRPQPSSHLTCEYSGVVAMMSEGTQSCPTLCDPMDGSLPGSSVYGVFQARTLEWVSHSLLQEIFLIQGLNMGLLHCRQVIFTIWVTIFPF